MRAALLPAGGDPFLLAYWFRNYRTWADHVDVLHVRVCGQSDPAIWGYLAGLAEALPHVVMRFAPRTDHGEVIRQLVEDTGADTVMLCEDDAFVRKPGKIGEMFESIESGQTDVVGCPRATGSDGMLDWARGRFGDWVAASGESGPILWPCFLFAKRDDLLRTDRRFGAWGWKAGEEVMGRTCPGDEALDTFGWATLQLREMGLRMRIEPNYRAQLERLAEWTDAPWFHVGGLSVGYGLYLLGGQSDREGNLEVVRGDQHDWQKRASWWQRVAEKWDGALPGHREEYLRELGLYMQVLDPGGVERWRRGFDSLVTWAE